jgi:TolA-binding protein
MLIGIIQNFDKKYAEGEQVLKEALAIRPVTEYDPKMLYILGHLYQNWGRRDSARAAYKQLLADFPDAPAASKAKDQLKKLDKPEKAEK